MARFELAAYCSQSNARHRAGQASGPLSWAGWRQVRGYRDGVDVSHQGVHNRAGAEVSVSGHWWVNGCEPRQHRVRGILRGKLGSLPAGGGGQHRQHDAGRGPGRGGVRPGVGVLHKVSRHPVPRAWVVRTALNAGASAWHRRSRETALASQDIVAAGSEGIGLDTAVLTALDGAEPVAAVVAGCPEPPVHPATKTPVTRSAAAGRRARRERVSRAGWMLPCIWSPPDVLRVLAGSTRARTLPQGALGAGAAAPANAWVRSVRAAWPRPDADVAGLLLPLGLVSYCAVRRGGLGVVLAHIR
jgi:hypothetical protein